MTNNTPNTPQELMNLNTPQENTPSVESVMEMMGELNWCEGMEVVLKVLEMMRDFHTSTGLEKYESGDKKGGFVWMKDGMEFNTVMNILKNIEME